MLVPTAFCHTGYSQTCSKTHERVPEQWSENGKFWKWSMEGEFANCCALTLCSSRVQRNIYSWTLNNQVNYHLQTHKTCCPEPCCSDGVLIASAIKNSESQRRALHLFRRMLLNSYTRHIPPLERVPLLPGSSPSCQPGKGEAYHHLCNLICKVNCPGS